jgi:hypothetical protein
MCVLWATRLATRRPVAVFPALLPKLTVAKHSSSAWIYQQTEKADAPVSPWVLVFEKNEYFLSSVCATATGGLENPDPGRSLHPKGALLYHRCRTTTIAWSGGKYRHQKRKLHSP